MTTIKRMLTTAALTAVAAASALGVSLAGAGTALAPEPVRLTQELSGSTGALGYAYYVHSTAQTTVRKWPGSWTPGSPPAGTPCSTVNLAINEVSYQTIQRYNSYAKCV